MLAGSLVLTRFNAMVICMSDYPGMPPAAVSASPLAVPNKSSLKSCNGPTIETVAVLQRWI